MLQWTMEISGACSSGEASPVPNQGQVSTFNKWLDGWGGGVGVGRMARPVRIERPGAWYHITGRGTERRSIYADERDRRRWLGLVGEAVLRFRWVVHGYVLMDNHYHLIVQTREANLSQSMQQAVRAAPEPGTVAAQNRREAE